MDPFGTPNEFAQAAIAGGARITGLMLLHPLFTMSGIAGFYAFVFGVALSVPFVLQLQADIISGAMPAGWGLFMLAGKELAIGAALGLVLGLPFWAFQAAGDVLDHSRGASMGNVVDPVNSNETTTTGTLLLVIALLHFAAAGGVPMMVETVYQTFRVWPVTAFLPPASPDIAAELGSLLMLMGKMAFALCAPILIAMLAIDTVLGLTGRMATQLQIFDLSNTLKGLILVALLPLYLMFFGDYFRAVFDAFRAVIDSGVAGLGR